MYCAIYFAGVCVFAYACVFYILRVCDIIHRQYTARTHHSRACVLCYVHYKACALLCQALAKCAYYDYDSSARDDKES